MTKPKEKYWLFWNYRGYMEQACFDTKKEALKRFKEYPDDGYQFPILIKGVKIRGKLTWQ